jgi:hypothetical protein
MKIAVIGGAGVRTPLLVKGLTRSDLPIEEIALFDVNPERLDAIASLARSYARTVKTFPTASLCVADADFVFLSIRAGGIEARRVTKRQPLRSASSARKRSDRRGLRWRCATFRRRSNTRGSSPVSLRARGSSTSPTRSASSRRR